MFVFIFLMLVLTAVMQTLVSRWFHHKGDVRGLAVCAVLSALVLLIPLGGRPIWNWLASANSVYSITLAALVLSRVWKGYTGTALLDRKARIWLWTTSVVAGAVLYPMALGVGSFDPYELGWAFSWLFVALLCLTLYLLLVKNRFALVLVGVIFAYDVRMLDSSNLWDYLVDPFVVIFSVFALINLAWAKVHSAGVGGREKPNPAGPSAEGVRNGSG